MQTPPFYKKYSFESNLSSDQLLSKLSSKLAEKETKDTYLFKGETNASIFKFYRIIGVPSRNSFNPIIYGEIVLAPNNNILINIRMRIAYPIYILWVIIFIMTVFAHITLTYGSFQTDGILGIMFATAIMAIFYSVHYFFYWFGFKRNTGKTISFLIPYLKLTKIE
jgi:hypothetical protein